MDNKIKGLEAFFDYDLKIKKIITSMNPSVTDTYNQEYSIMYEDKMFQYLDEIDFYLSKIIDALKYSDTEKERVSKLINKSKNAFANANNDLSKLKKAYVDHVSNMREEFLKALHSDVSAYYIFSGLTMEPVTINEYLHYLHHQLVNDEYLYSSLVEVPMNNNRIHLYGSTENMIAYQLASQLIQDESYATNIDILGLKNRIIIMTRGYGHATTIEIELEPEQNMAYVQYFVPKICNIDKASNLRGVHKIEEDEAFAKGGFGIPIDDVPMKITEFIMSVPTDDDIGLDRSGHSR